MPSVRAVREHAVKAQSIKLKYNNYDDDDVDDDDTSQLYTSASNSES